MGPPHDKTGVFCKHEHRAGEIEAQGIDYTIENVCSITKKIWAKDARKRKRGPRTKAMCDTVDRKQGLPKQLEHFTAEGCGKREGTGPVTTRSCDTVVNL